MKKIVVFNHGKVIAELDHWPKEESAVNALLPTGTWYLHTGDWYLVTQSRTDWYKRVPTHEVPKEYQLLALLLS